MHGGFSAHLVDSITTAALMTNEGGLPGVSVDLHMTYMKVKTLSLKRKIKDVIRLPSWVSK